MDKKVLSGLEAVQQIVNREQTVPFQNNLSIIFLEAAEGYLKTECRLDPARHGNGLNDNVHGGVIAGMADDIGGFVAVTTVREYANNVFMGNIFVNFRNPAKVNGPVLRAEARVRDRTKSNALVDVEIYQGETLIAQAIGNVVIRAPQV